MSIPGNVYCSILLLFFLQAGPATLLRGQEKYNNMDQVKVAAVQISGYDKTVIPGLEIDMVGKAVPYIERAARDSAHLVVFPEYCLGRIEIPGKETKALSNPIP